MKVIRAFKKLNTWHNADDLTIEDMEDILLEHGVTECDKCNEYRQYETTDDSTICVQCYEG